MKAIKDNDQEQPAKQPPAAGMLLRKISAGEIIGSKAVLREIAESGKGTPVVIFGIAGEVDSFEHGQTEGIKANWTRFTGRFVAVPKQGRLVGSKVFGSAAFLPEPIQGILVRVLESGASPIDFACNIYVVQDENSPVGYTYGVIIPDAANLEASHDRLLKALEGKGMLLPLPGKPAATLPPPPPPPPPTPTPDTSADPDFEPDGPGADTSQFRLPR